MIYRIVSEADFRSLDDGQQYLPSGFAADGFVHCALLLTKGERGCVWPTEWFDSGEIDRISAVADGSS